MTTLTGNEISKINFNIFKKAFFEQDEYCVKLVDEIVSYLCCVISNISTLLDIELIIIGGGIIELGNHFIELVRKNIVKLSPLPANVVFTELGEKAGIYGAFAVAIERIFKYIID